MGYTKDQLLARLQVGTRYRNRHHPSIAPSLLGLFPRVAPWPRRSAESALLDGHTSAPPPSLNFLGISLAVNPALKGADFLPEYA